MILRAVGLVRRYGAVRALDGLDLDVAPGEVVGLLGPNGAGKSTAFRLLAGLERPDRGAVLLDGRDVTRWPLHRRARAGLAYVPQHAAVLPRVSVRGNLALAGGPTERLLAEADLLALADRPAGTLSGGERRRLELARAAALEPRVLLLDEPFAGVDPRHVARVRATIRAFAARGCGVLLTDHAVREALGTCDRAAVLDAGVVQVAGTPAEVARDPWAIDRYLGPTWAALASEMPEVSLHDPDSSYNVRRDSVKE